MSGEDGVPAVPEDAQLAAPAPAVPSPEVIEFLKQTNGRMITFFASLGTPDPALMTSVPLLRAKMVESFRAFADQIERGD